MCCSFSYHLLIYIKCRQTYFWLYIYICIFFFLSTRLAPADTTMPIQSMNIHELSPWISARALRGPCRLIKGRWRLHPSPYVFFHSETSPVGTFPSSVKPENVSNCRDHQWVEDRCEIFRTAHWHELDLPGKVMRRYRGNGEHHRYVKKVARRGVEGRLN